MFVVRISDETASIQLRFFILIKVKLKILLLEKNVRCFGELRLANNVKEVVHPECQFFENERPPLDEFLTPVYPLTEGCINIV